MWKMFKIADKHEQINRQKNFQLPPEVKIEEDEPQVYTQFQVESRFELLNIQIKENSLENFASNDGPQNGQLIPSINPFQISSTPNNQALEKTIQIVEENSTQKNQLFQLQNNHFFSSNWLLSRHPNSLFKKLKPVPQISSKKLSKLLSPSNISTFEMFHSDIQAIDQKLIEIRNLDPVKIPKVQYKTKKIPKSANFKPRKGKNQQPMTQKLIKKLSGFHYNKNYKQNRNKTLKKMAKRGLAINLENFTTYFGKLKLQINKKFKKPDMKIKRNANGEVIDPKHFYGLYNFYFSFPKEREFVQRFYNEVFKRVYVIMWKSDERLKRVDSIKIQGVHYNVETDPSSELKFEPKENSSEKQPITESRPEDKRAAFVQCLDEAGKKQLQQVFHEEYDKLYKAFDWSTRDSQFIKPQKDDFMKKIEKFSCSDD